MTSNSGHLGRHLVLVTGDIQLNGSALTDTFQYFTSEDQHTPEAKLSDLFGLPSSQKHNTTSLPSVSPQCSFPSVVGVK